MQGWGFYILSGVNRVGEKLLSFVRPYRSDYLSPASRVLLREGIEAFRLTREYVGEETLPPIEGWTWYEWTKKAQRALDRDAEIG